MLTALATRTVDELKSRETLCFLVLLAVSLAGFVFIKYGVFYAAGRVDTLYGLIGIAAALFGLQLRAADYALPTRIVVLTVFCVFGVYAVTGFPTMPADQFGALDAFILEYGRFIAAASAVAAFWRPSLGLILLTYVTWHKGVSGGFIGAAISGTDYMALIEVAAFLVISRMAQAVLERLNIIHDAAPPDERSLRLGEKLFLVGIAVHMANYFYSAVMKAQIGDHFFSWVFVNPTQVLITNAQAYGQLPIGFSPFLTGLAYEGMESLIILSNLIMFCGQLFALFALLRVRWGIWTTLFYDLTHTVIFITTGIFFYKWIILNLSIVAALETMRRRVVTPAFGLIIMTMLLISPMFFFVVWLGWWDSPQSNIEYFSAVTKNGRTVRIPSNYFGAFSLNVAQQRVIFDKSNGFLVISTYGLTRDQRILEQGMQCALPMQQSGEQDVIEATFSDPDNKIVPFIQNYHRWALQHAGEDGRWAFDLYPHHIFSFPWGYDEFYALNLNDIVAYRYTIESACVRYKDGKADIAIQKEGHHDIPVSQP